MTSSHLPYENVQAYGPGRFPHGPCQHAGCTAAACHRSATKDGVQVLVCTAHLPEGTLFSPYLGQQEKLFACTARRVLGGGGAGGSKTYAGSRLFLKQWHIEQQRFLEAKKTGKRHRSKGYALFLRRTTGEFQQVIQDFFTYFQILDPGAKWDAKYNICTFTSEYRVRFGGCEGDDDWRKYYGEQYTLCVIDEAAQFTIKQIEQIDSRIRCTDPILGKMLQLYLLTNPVGGETKLWLRQRFVECAPPEEITYEHVKLKDGRIQKQSKVYIPFNVYDNPGLVADGEYEANLLLKGDNVVEALLRNNWFLDDGSWIGKDWIPSEHICAPFKIPRSWTRVKSHDGGWVKAPVLWWAIDPNGGVVLYRAITFTEMTAAEIAQRIREIELSAGEWDTSRDVSAVMGPADRSLWGKQGEAADSRGEQYDRAHVGFYRAKNSYAGYVRDAADQVRKRLRRRVPDPFDVTGQRSVAGLRIFSNTIHKIHDRHGPRRKSHDTGPLVTVPSLPFEESDPEVWDTTADDHDMDAIGYFCMSRPLEGEAERPGDPANATVAEILQLRREEEGNSDDAPPLLDWSSNG